MKAERVSREALLELLTNSGIIRIKECGMEIPRMT